MRPGEHRIVALIALAAACLVTGGLVVCGLETIPVRTFALRVPDQQPAAGLAPGQHPCEGPIRSADPFDQVGIFGLAQRGTPLVSVTIRSSTGRLLAAGTRFMPRARGERFVTLDRAVPGSRPVTICLSGKYGEFVVMGSTIEAPGVTATEVFAGTQFALVTARRSSFLASLTTAFDRAAIFRPSWVGAWTFWLLLAGLLVAGLGLAGVAVGAASREDDAG